MSDFVFHSLVQALQAGFMVYDQTKDGYIVRRKGRDDLWEMALVKLTDDSKEWR